jgi:single-strand DNA-binding protein
MPYANIIVLSGHLAKDPELRYTNSGKGVTNFTLAVKRKYGDETDFIKVECWNKGNYKLAEYVTNDLKKGKLTTVIGELNIDKYNDNYYTKVNADKVIYDKNVKENKEDKVEEDFDVPF